MADVPVPSIATATPADADSVLGVQGGAVKRFLVSALKSAITTFLQSGTGAVSRSTQDKLREQWYSVKDFGAVGDGVTNDAPAINAAITAANAAGGGIVFIPSGTYAQGGTIVLKSKVTLQGSGASSILKVSGNYSLINEQWNSTTSTDEKITVRDLVRDCNNLASNGVTLAGVTDGLVENVIVRKQTGYGIWIWRSGEDGPGGIEGKPSTRCRVIGCTIEDCTDVGIEFSGATNSQASHNVVYVTSGIGGLYAWNGAQDIIFSDNIVIGKGSAPNAIGIAVQPRASTFTTNTARIKFVNNMVSNVSKGVRVSGTTGFTPVDVSIEGGELVGHASSVTGVDIGECSGSANIRGVLIKGFATPLLVSNVPAGAVFGSAPNVIFDDNMVIGDGYSGTSSLYGMTSGSVSRNQWRGLSNHAVRMYGCKNVVANGNSFIDLGLSGNAEGIILQKHTATSTECSGIIAIGNKSTDLRGTKWTRSTITIGDATDYIIAMGNSAYGAKSGSSAVSNAGTGANNVIVSNING